MAWPQTQSKPVSELLADLLMRGSRDPPFHPAGEERVEVGERYFTARLAPGSEVDLEVGMERFCEQPTYAFPWQGDGIPFR